MYVYKHESFRCLRYVSAYCTSSGRWSMVSECARPRPSVNFLASDACLSPVASLIERSSGVVVEWVESVSRSVGRSSDVCTRHARHYRHALPTVFLSAVYRTADRLECNVSTSVGVRDSSFKLQTPLSGPSVNEITRRYHERVYSLLMECTEMCRITSGFLIVFRTKILKCSSWQTEQRTLVRPILET